MLGSSLFLSLRSHLLQRDNKNKIRLLREAVIECGGLPMFNGELIRFNITK